MTTSTRPIVVGYDNSPEAELALLWAMRTAELERTDLRVVVVALTTFGQPTFILDHVEYGAQAAAAAARDLLKTAPEVKSDVVVERGWPLDALVAASHGASLIVVGSRGFGHLDGLWLGSVSQHLASHAACPVAVVRAPYHPLAGTIVVGVDGSPPSVRALAHAARRATLTRESVLAVHAYPFPHFAGHGAIGATALDIRTEVSDAAERLVSELVAGLVIDFPDVPIRTTAVVGRAGRVLARMSDEASLVVVGSRGRTPFRELVLGSVSHETLHRAACPVLVVR